MEPTNTVKRIVEAEVLTLANGIVDKFVELDRENGGASFWEEVENLWPEGEEDGDQHEVYQWFIVSGWLFDKLGEVRAVRVEYAGAYFWGRTEYGIALEYDGDLTKVGALLDSVLEG